MFVTTFVIGIFALFLILATIAPLGSLGWWAGWYGEELALDEIADVDGDGVDVGDWAHALFYRDPGSDATRNRADDGLLASPSTAQVVHSSERAAPQSVPTARQVTHFIVYLSGIGAFTGTSIPREELPFIEALRTRLPGSCVITDVFPYSVTNVGLTGERLFAHTWRLIEAQRPQHPNSLWLYLVVVRNLFQVMVSADRRYGPIYNFGVAKEIWRSLLSHGYRPGAKLPVTLIGVSGGSQIAVGAVSYLAKVIDSPVQLISLGGVIASDPGLLQMKHLYHLYGANDHTQKLSYIFPGRWPIAVNSAWNRAKARGLITEKITSPADHVGKNSHFDQSAFVEDGRSYFDITLQEVLAIL